MVKSKNKSKNAGALDGGGQFLLVDEAVAGDATGQNLPAFGLEALQEVDVLEVDFVDFVFAEAALFLADHLAATMLHIRVFHLLVLQLWERITAPHTMFIY